MGDSLGTVRVAAVQAASVFLDREQTVSKTVELIHEAGRSGAQLIVFPEGFIPAHPVWFHFHAATSEESLGMATELFQNAVVIGGDDTRRIAEATRDEGVWAVVGMCEKRGGTTGTMWNSAVHFAPDGTIAAVHRKLTPTVGERLVHMGGGSEGLVAPRTPFGIVSSLICAENSNPLLQFTASAQYSVVHAALWPCHFSPTQPVMRDVIVNSSRAIAYEGGCYVVNAAGTLLGEAKSRVGAREEDFAWLRDPKNLGGSCIVSPSGKIIAGPAGDEETILTAELDLDALVTKRVLHDFAGHYNRADILSLSVAGPQRDILRGIPTYLSEDRVETGEEPTARSILSEGMIERPKSIDA